jgi:hypothetical protein
VKSVPSALSGSDEKTGKGPAPRRRKMRTTGRRGTLEAIGWNGGGNDGGERRPRREEEKSVGGEGEAEEWLCFAMLLFLVSCEGEGWGD